MLEKRWSNFICFILACVTSFSFSIENDIYVVTEEVASKWQGLLWQIKSAICFPTYVAMILIVMIFFAYRQLWPKVERKLFKWSIPFAAVGSLVLLLCESYHKYDSWDKVFGGESVFLLSVVRGSGIGVLFFFCFHLINTIWIGTEESISKQSWKKFLMVMGIMMLCWMPYIIIMFPGNVCPDTADEVAQILGESQYCWTIRSIIPEYTDTLWNNHHPVFYTWILSLFVKLGDIIGSHAWGFEIYSFLQCTCLAAVLAYNLKYMEELGVPKKIRRGMLLFFALNPLFPLWGVTFTKDIPFSFVLLMVVVQLYKILKGSSSPTLSSIVNLGIWAFLLMLLRNNGFYMLLALIPFAVWLLWKDKKKMVRLLAAIVLPLLIFQIVIQGMIFPALHISKGSVREMMSIPFQQTARYVKEYKKEVRKEDRKNILALLGDKKNTLKDIGDNYVPDRADRIKNRYNAAATKEDMKNYIKTWAKGLVSHPDVYIEAFFNLNYGWFGFESRQDFSHYNGITGIDITKMMEEVRNPESLAGARKYVQYFFDILSRLPFSVWMIEFSFYTWAYVVFLLLMLIRKKYYELVACCVIYANYFICFIGPVAYTRYAIPMIVCAPFVLVLTFAKEQKS